MMLRYFLERYKYLITIIFLLTLLMFCFPNHSYAVIQSNSNTATSKTHENWMLQIRQMQQSGGGLGLTNTVNNSNLTSNNNNLDIHMIRNSEYGAAVLLGASQYGNTQPLKGNITSTGNATGINFSSQASLSSNRITDSSTPGAKNRI